MEYVQLSSSETYSSWVKLERSALELLQKLNEYSGRIVIDESEPIANNILFFDASYLDG